MFTLNDANAFLRRTTLLASGMLALGIAPLVYAQDSGHRLVAAKHLAYDANFRNDPAGLKLAIKDFELLKADANVAGWAFYYSGWTWWCLAASQIQDHQQANATASLNQASLELRKAVALLPENADAVALLASSLVAQGSIDHSKFPELLPQINQLRQRAIGLGPDNPRVVMMDAGMLFWTPPERGGGQEKGIARWLAAIELFDQERIDDPLLPDWGRVLAYGWLANLYLQMTPPRLDDARKMAARALELRPDFWFVKTQVLPKVGRPQAEDGGVGSDSLQRRLEQHEAETTEAVKVHMSKKREHLIRSAPYFPVGDVERSMAFYELVLGFHREYVAGAPPQFAIMNRDGLALMLRLVPRPERIRPNEKQGGTWDAFFWVRDAQHLHDELRKAGADVIYGPIVQEAYRMKEFAVRDCDGHVLGFGEALEGSD